ncbi:hypothetical protein B0T26DRAFT_709787 [Lasiosphaeria miniovina]|uniref:Uncharacterized protein n=1 Tax=Lasiosphaeria miniovina TaxID=1954250 RepID=A0AA40AKE7_9PEZI|nr:uncharacterized protein B0T26DRAFT_709787 [Lasiosphaeria miniovina]KAK0717387.1 hypothetical protein B0T26DRAFT_709787 [Lasiosphaeria miniovina]
MHGGVARVGAPRIQAPASSRAIQAPRFRLLNIPSASIVLTNCRIGVESAGHVTAHISDLHEFYLVLSRPVLMELVLEQVSRHCLSATKVISDLLSLKMTHGVIGNCEIAVY